MAPALLHRRAFLHALPRALAAGELVAALHAAPETPGRATRRRIKAVAFDGFAVFDATRVTPVAEAMFPGQGRALAMAWRARQFEYQWLRTLGDRYVDFRRTANDGLTFAVRDLGLDLDADRRARLLDALLALEPWPDAVAVIERLHAAGVRLAFLSNMTRDMLDAGARRAGIRDAFAHVLSTDLVRAAKPDGRAYALARDAFRLPPEQIAFVAFAGWDAAGARWFGYPTIWTNRMAAPVEELGTAPDVTCRGLDDASAFVLASR